MAPKPLTKTKLALLEKASLETTEEPKFDFEKAKVIKAYDGDTITIAAWYGDELSKFTVRINGIDTAEIKGGTPETKALAKQAKVFVSDLILNKIVDIQVLKKDKYGRLLANVSIEGQDIAKSLLDNKLAKEYSGGKKEAFV